MVGETNVDDLMDNIISKLSKPPSCMYPTDRADQLPGEQAKTGFEQYLQTLKVSKVRSLEDIIQFNKDNADLEFDHGMFPPGATIRATWAEHTQTTARINRDWSFCSRWQSQTKTSPRRLATAGNGLPLKELTR